MEKNNQTNNIIKFSEKMEIDMMIQLAKQGHSFYRELFKKLNSIINAGTPQFAVNDFLQKEVKEYCLHEHIENHYLSMLEKYDTPLGKTNLPFDNGLIKMFFKCTEKIDSNKKKIYVFTIVNEKAEVIKLFESHRAKENNAWKDFIKNWWHLDKNHDKRIECYMDVYNAICELENSEEIIENNELQNNESTDENMK